VLFKSGRWFHFAVEKWREVDDEGVLAEWIQADGDRHIYIDWESGLVEIGPRGGRTITKPAPWREIPPLPIEFVASIARQVRRSQ
jgi:hypothetical protein